MNGRGRRGVLQLTRRTFGPAFEEFLPGLTILRIDCSCIESRIRDAGWGGNANSNKQIQSLIISRFSPPGENTVVCVKARVCLFVYLAWMKCIALSYAAFLCIRDTSSDWKWSQESHFLITANVDLMRERSMTLMYCNAERHV